MIDTTTGEDSTPGGSGAPGGVADNRGPHLGRYPLKFPKVSDPRLHLAMVTGALQVLGQTTFNFELSIAQILVSIATCAVIELAVTIRRDSVIAWPASALLTGNSIALILRVPGTLHGDWWSLRGWWVFAGTAVVAMASKHLIRTRGHNMFNPSNFALVVAFLVLGENIADPQGLWWGPLSIGLVIAFATILFGGGAIIRRVRQVNSAASFWVVFAAAMAVIAASGHSMTARWHVGPIAGWDYWWLLVSSPEVLVFTFFMTTDPKPAPKGRVAQLIYGTAIAGLAAALVSTQSGEFGTKVGILGSLVVVFLFVGVIESHSPAARTSDDHFAPWFKARLAPPGTSRGTRIARSLALLGAVIIFALGLAVSASHFSAPEADIPALQRRGEVNVDPTSLPKVRIDPDAVATSITLDQALADRMGLNTVQDLELESAALTQRDPSLAAAGLTGTRLQQAEDRIDSGTSDAPQYSFDSLTATVIRTSSGPQAPPHPAVRAKGKITSGQDAGDFDITFILSPAADVYLIADAYDADGNPIGTRPGAVPAIEAAEETDGPEPTEAQLAGLAFEDVTDQAGLDLPHSERRLREGPAAWSGGAAVGDYDGDGDVDVFLTRVGLPNALMRNDSGHFTDSTAGSGITPAPDDTGSTGAMFVDLNGDERLDLVVLGLDRTPNRLWMASPTGGFSDATQAWGLPSAAPPSADAGQFSLAAADYDRDGRVDLLIADSEPHGRLDGLPDEVAADADRCALATTPAPPGATPPTSRTTLLRNTGAGFEDSTNRLGIDTATVAAITPRFADVNGDGWQDILIAGGLCTSKVLINDGSGGFVDATSGSGIDRIDTAIGSELLDADSDGNIDWFVTGVSYPTASGDCPVTDPSASCSGNHLMLGRGDGTFTDATDRFGLRDGYWGWGAVAADFNLDGRTDLMMTNGYRGVQTQRPDDGRSSQRPYYERAVEDPDRLWLNVPDTEWPEAAEQTGLSGTDTGKAAIPLDYDSDGLVDLLVINTDGSPRLYRNSTENENHWLTVRLHDGDASNTAAVAAVVTATLPDGESLTRTVSADGSFQSGRSTESHFGLGSTDSVAALRITWPDGNTTELGAQEVDRTIEVPRQTP